jgi:hypothetical protein
MAKQKIVWTALPYGRITEGDFAGRLRVSIVVSPRLTPAAASEQQLGAADFSDFHNWPKTLDAAKLSLDINGSVVPLEIISKRDPTLWGQFFTDSTPVEGFVFNDMSRVNLRSYSVRNVLGFVRKHYGNLAVMSAGTHPTLLPWKDAHGSLKGMLTDLNTRTSEIVLGNTVIRALQPGFDRFFDDKNQESLERRMRGLVFGPDAPREPVVGIDGSRSDASIPLRALPGDWRDPATGGKHQAIMSQFQTADEYTFYQANRFYHRSTPSDAQRRLRRPNLENVPPPPKPPEFDFHRIVASLADTPHVLRALGLIIDCVLPKDNPIDRTLASAVFADGILGLEVEWANDHDRDADGYPRTAFAATRERFFTRARSADHRDGLLALANTHDPTLGAPRGQHPRERSPFDVFQVDPDGAALKTVDFLLTAQNMVGKSFKPGTHGEVTYTTGDKQPVAALRSGGLGVSRHDRAADVASSAGATALKNTAIETSAGASRKIVLFIEDVIRGYRVDVQTRDKWFSLCKREGDYTLQKSQQALSFPPDEGYVKGASTTGDGGDDHYLHEAMFRWTGWSLVAQRPGRTLRAVEGGGGLQGESVQDVQDTATTGNGLEARFRAQRGTLPKMRFGSGYRFRARIADLAGNSLDVDDRSMTPLEQATDEVSYLRYEPADPPALVHKHRVSEGESLERMVIRSNFNQDPTAYLSSPDFAAAIALPASADFRYVAENERHVVPPKSSQLQCEHHALFDKAFGSADPDTIKAAYETAAREAGTLYDKLPGANIELVTPASVADIAQTTTFPPVLPSPTEPTGERMVGGQYIVHGEDAVITPYLPDGAAGGLSLRGMSREDFARIGIVQPMVLGPGAEVIMAPNEELVLLVWYAKEWPDTLGLRIVLREREHALDDGPCAETFPDDGRPKWDETNRVLTFFMRKGHIARLRYASFIDKAFIDQFGLPRWTNNASERTFVEAMALLGMHWMMTPYRSLVMVHATQQPVCTPRLSKVTPARNEGATFADLEAAVQLHGPSTGKVEVVAHWHEWIDDVQKPAPVRIDMSARLTEIMLPENGPNNFMLAGAANATQPPPPNNIVTTEKRAKGNRHDFGDTKFRLVRYQLEATTRFREYLPPSLFAQAALITRTGPEALESMALVGTATDFGAPVLFNVAGATADGTVVRNTAAPDVPTIVYTVPTFRWDQNLGIDKPTQTSVRLGNALRVYLERPWFSSGDGELLGVVLAGDGKRFTDIDEALVPYVTQWGLDPLHDSAVPRADIKAANFPARVTSENLNLRETGSAVHVVGHRVQWDDARKLWFADIEIDSGASYMPFVRLALVRYQPHSLPNMKVSRVSMAEFAQVLPRRRAVVKINGPSVQVSMHGIVPAHGPMMFPKDSPHLNISFIPPFGSAGETGRNKFELILQTRDPNIDSDLAWSDVATLAEGLVAPGGSTPPVTGGVGTLGGLATEVTSTALQPATRAPSTITRAAGLGDRQTFASQILIPSATVSAAGAAATAGSLAVGVAVLFDPAIWNTNVTLPTFTGQARLVLREFERYYTDRTVPERIGTVTHRRRVVEERLVYSEFFPLN